MKYAPLSNVYSEVPLKVDDNMSIMDFEKIHQIEVSHIAFTGLVQFKAQFDGQIPSN
jgi:hypothetical protein